MHTKEKAGDSLLTETVLALHLGKGVGWCSGPTALGVWTFPDYADDGFKGCALVDTLAGMCNLPPRPTVIVVSGSAEDPGISAEAAVLQIGLLMCVRVIAQRRAIRVEVPSVQAVRDDTLGPVPRSGLNAAVKGLARRRGLNTIDLDTAHALLLWSWRAKQNERKSDGTLPAIERD